MKTDHNTKISKIKNKVSGHGHDKYITISEFNKLTTENFTARLAQANLVTKTNFDPEWKSFHKKINSNKTKYLLVENELKKLQAIDSSYFRGKNSFEEDSTRNYLVL